MKIRIKNLKESFALWGVVILEIISIVLVCKKTISVDIFGIVSLYAALVLACDTCKKKKWGLFFFILEVVGLFIMLLFIIMECKMKVIFEPCELLVFGLMGALVNIGCAIITIGELKKSN